MAGVILLLSVVLSLVTFVVCQDIRDPPTIVEPLTKVSHFYKVNDRVTITCRATGNPQPMFEWRHNDAPITSHFMSFDAVTGVLTISSLTEREEGFFTCRATNRFPNGQSATAVSATVEIRVARVGDFVKSPAKTIPAQEGKYLKLACDDKMPIYYGPTSFKWYITTLDDRLTEINQDDRKFIDQVGSLHFAYTLKSDESVLGTRYQCAIQNSGQGIIKLGSENIITVTAQGLQDQKPVLQYRSMGKSMVVLRNQDALLECLFSGYTSNAANKVPSVTWFDDAGVQISGNGRYVIGPFGRTLTIKNVQESDEKTYTCRASNALGQEEGQASLNVTSIPIWVKPLEKVTVLEGESAKFTCLARSAAGENPPDTPDWYLNGMRMASNYDPTKYIFSDRKRELTVLHTNKDTDIACFQCYVYNSNGYEFDDGCLNVILQINIFVQPPKLNQEIEKGDIVNLTVVASGDPSTPLTYRWIFRNKTFDDLSPPPHVQVNSVTKLAFINTTELSEAELKDITGIYQREVFHKYQAKHVNIEVTLKRPSLSMDPYHPANIPLIAGTVFGGTLLVIIIVVVIVLYRRSMGAGTYDKPTHNYETSNSPLYTPLDPYAVPCDNDENYDTIGDTSDPVDGEYLEPIPDMPSCAPKPHIPALDSKPSLPERTKDRGDYLHATYNATEESCSLEEVEGTQNSVYSHSQVSDASDHITHARIDQTASNCSMKSDSGVVDDIPRKDYLHPIGGGWVTKEIHL